MVAGKFLRRWREYRQLVRELKSYSDVELAELGLVRSACARTAFLAAFGKPVVGAEPGPGPGVPSSDDGSLCAAAKQLDICSIVEQAIPATRRTNALRVGRGSDRRRSRDLKNDATVSIPARLSANA